MRLLIDLIREGIGSTLGDMPSPSESASAAADFLFPSASSPVNGEENSGMDVDSTSDTVDDKSSVSGESEGSTKRKRKRKDLSPEKASPTSVASTDIESEDVVVDIEMVALQTKAKELDGLTSKRQKLKESNQYANLGNLN